MINDPLRDIRDSLVKATGQKAYAQGYISAYDDCTERVKMVLKKIKEEKEAIEREIKKSYYNPGEKCILKGMLSGVITVEEMIKKSFEGVLRE